jgi:protein-S-isoprenylcysteine O-methyltransferase Ste14
MMSQRTPLPPTILVIALVLMVALHLLAPGPRLLRLPVGLLGLLPLAAGIGLNLAADALLKRRRTTVKPFEESAALVTSGVYGWSRHPMYLGFVLLVLGVALLLGSLTPFALVLGLPVVLEALYMRTEERMLAARFGDAWTAYRSRVRRWL